ncbi:MAG: PAS domain-containing sensor histidine kinase, partial [Nitrospinales bacterium]
NEKNIQIHSQLDDNVGTLLLDHQKLKQVVINLFHNALESMPEGGKLTVETYRENDDQGREIVTIRIEDTGGGIPQEVYLNVFNPFFTTKGSGTGLGLPICRKIVASLGGTIRLENQIGKGVTVFIQLSRQKSYDYCD